MGCPVMLLGWFERFREYICSPIHCQEEITLVYNLQRENDGTCVAKWRMSKHRLESLTHRSYNVCCHSRPRVTLPQNGSVSGGPRDQGIQDIPRQSWRICHLNVIYVHRMLLLKIIVLCVQEKDHIVQYMGICCTYLYIGMYNVYKGFVF